MGPQDRKRTGRLKTWLIYAALAIIAFFPQTAFTSSSIAGEWQTSFIQNGASITVYLTLNDDGTATYNKYMGIYQVSSVSLNWSTDGDTICFFGPDSRPNCGAVRLPSSTRLAITMGGQTVVYGRNPSQPSFTGSFHCTHKGCKCPGWAGGSSYSSPCPYKDCGHKYVEHAGPAD